MNILSKIAIILGAFFIINCGGGGSSGTSSSTISYTVKTLNKEGKKKYTIQKEDSQDLLDMTKSFFAIAGEVSELDLENAIGQKANVSQKCQVSGTISQQVLASNNQLTLTYRQCNIGSSIIIDGDITYVLDKTINGRSANYAIGKNFKVTIGDESTILNYTIKSYQGAYDIKLWDYYVQSKDVNTGEKWEAELHISQGHEKTYFSGTFMLNEKEYFDFLLSSGEDYGIRVFGPPYKYLYKSYITDENDVLTLKGRNSELTYTLVYIHPDWNRIFIYTNAEGIGYAKDEDILHWLETPYTLVDNHYEPRLFINVNDIDLSINKDTVSLHSSSTILSLYFTDTDEIGLYELNVKLISKPNWSNISLDMDHTTYHDNEDISTTLSFDIDGTYHYRITLTDGHRIVEKDFYVKYYHTDLADNQFLIENNTTEAILLKDSEHIAYIGGDLEYTLTVSDLEANPISSISLSQKPHKIALSEDGKSMAVSAYKKVYLVDIHDIENLTILNSWDFPGELGDIKIYKDHIYVLRSEGNSSNNYNDDLYNISIADNSYTTYQNAIEYGGTVDGKIGISSTLDSLYIINYFGDIYKFNIESGSIVWDSNLSFRDSPLKCCDNNFWFTSQEEFLTAYGKLIHLSDIEDEDISHVGTLESDNLIVGDNNSYKTIIKAADANITLNRMIIAIEEKDPDLVLKKNEVYKNVLEIYALNSTEREETYSLQTYWKHENMLYRLFVEDIQILSENKVFVTYKAYPVKDAYLEDEYLLLSYAPLSMIIYEIKTLE